MRVFECVLLICIFLSSGVLALENSSDINETIKENATNETIVGNESNAVNDSIEFNESFKNNITEKVNDTNASINNTENETLIKNNSDFILNDSANFSVMNIFFEVMDFLKGSNYAVNFFRLLVSYVDFSGDYSGNAVMSMNPLSKASGGEYTANAGYPGVGVVSDSISPTFIFMNVSSSVITNGSNVTINVGVEDNVQVDSVLGVITLPNETNISIGSFPFNYTSPENIFGRCNLTFYANDTSGNNVVATDWFEIAKPLDIMLNVSVSSGNFTFNLIYPEAEDIIFETETDDAFQLEIPDVIYDAEFSEIFNGTMNLTLRGVNLSANMNEVINLDKHRQLTDYLVVYGIDTNYSFDVAEVVFSYAGESYNPGSDLQLWKCYDYDFDKRICSGSWIDITSNSKQNTTESYFAYNTTSFSGFSIKEYVAPVTPDAGKDSLGCGIGYEIVNGQCVEIREGIGKGVEAIPKQLFDITWNLDDLTIENVDGLVGWATFESFGTLPTLVNLTFIVLDNQGNEIYQGEGSITVITEDVFRWRFAEEGLDSLPEGEYVAVLQTLYNVDVFDEFRQEFRIGKEIGITTKITNWFKDKGKWWLGVVVGGILVGVVWWLIKMRKVNEKKKKLSVKVRKKPLFKRKKSIILVKKKSRKKS